MTIKEILKKYNISDATLRNWKKLNYIDNLTDIDPTDIDNILKQKTGIRRNKRTSVNCIIPTSYINDKNIIPIIEKIIAIKNKYHISNNEILIETILKILTIKKLAIPNDIYDILGKRSTNINFTHDFNKIKIKYKENNDFLGCLYMSLISIGKKDINGIYYTPFKVVNQIVESISFKNQKGIVDPGCGSGNFLIQTFKKMRTEGISTNHIIKNLYGFDIDNIAVLLSKINIYILDSKIKFHDIKVFNADFLNDDFDIKFDIVIGNPPWGKKYTNQEKNTIKEKYDLSFSKLDSFSQFIIRSFTYLNDGGSLSFVLPSSVLNIAVHENIRKFLLHNTIEYIKKIGREFDEIVTDVIIIKVTKTPGAIHHMCLYDNQLIEQQKFRDNRYSNFLISDDISYSIIDKIKKHNCFHLVNDVTYALGVVTGDNKTYLLDSKTNNSEPIISGKEIDKYNMDYSKITKYIKFEKEKLQQVAKEELYRYKNKIIYKFIGKKLYFAVETKGTLTLNSANLLCLSDNYDIYYISAILNSRITQLYFEDTYNTHKVLKNHIQSFYIPDFDQKLKCKLSNLSKNTNPSPKYNEEIENLIYQALKLNNNEIEYLKNRFQ